MAPSRTYIELRPCRCQSLMISLALLLAAAPGAAAHAAGVCGDVYGGTWSNPPFGYNIYKNGTAIQYTSGVFDAPDGTPIALDAAGNIFHAQTIDAQGTVRVYRNNVPATTFGPRGGPSWVYSGLGLAIQPDGVWYAGFYSADTTVTIYRNGNNVYRTYAAYNFASSPVQLAWDNTNGHLYASIRTGANETTVYAEDTAVAVYSNTRGCGVAARGGHWYTAVPTGSAQITVYRDNVVFRTINGSFTASYHVNLALDGRGDPFILVPVSGGAFGIFDAQGTRLYTLPNTAGGGGTGLWIQTGDGLRAGRPELRRRRQFRRYQSLRPRAQRPGRFMRRRIRTATSMNAGHQWRRVGEFR